VFIIVTVGAAVYVSVAADNYLHFYPAIARLDSTVTRLVFVPGGGSSQPRLIASVAVNNPSDYSGFTIRRAEIEMFFFVQNNYNKTVFDFPNRLTSYALPSGNIPSNSADSFDITVALNPTQATQLADFNSTYSSQGVVGWTNLRVDISTFLVAATGTTILDHVQNVTLTR
jgi:hypothetical protein